MKKQIIIFIVMLLGITSASAQIMRSDELEKYAVGKYGSNWVEAATNLGANIVLDKDYAMTLVQEIDAPGKTKEELYVLLNNWYTSSFHGGDCVISQNDKELGTITAQGKMSNIGAHSGGQNSYDVSIRPIIKTDIEDEKVRVTYTIPNYSAIILKGGGFMNAYSGDEPDKSYESWTLDSCYPFAAKDKHKKTSCKAFVMAYAYSNVIMDKIEECIKSGIVGKGGDKWNTR